MILSDILTNVRRLVEDGSSFRWTDKVITEYIVEGVNEIFRKTGGVTDSSPYDLIAGESEYVVGETGRITSVRIRPVNNTQTITLPQVQVEELPIDFSDDKDPTCYALSQVAIQGDSGSTGTIGGTQATLTDQGVTYTAVADGTAGNNITVELADPSATSSPLSINVVSTAITVDLETDGSGTIITTGDELIVALLADSSVTALLTPSGGGTTALSVLAATNLSGGTDGAVSEPEYSTEGAGSLTEKQKILFNTQPSRSTSGALDGVYGFYVDISREFELVLAGNTATAGENSTVIPVLPKFDRHLTNLVAGYLLIELNDGSLVQKGQYLQDTAMQYITGIGYVNSISFYGNTPNRQFP